MASEHEKLQKLTLCEYCKHKFKNPVILPCGESICRRHVHDMFRCTDEDRSRIFCFFCGEEHYYDHEKGYPPNKLLQGLIEIEMEKSEIRYEEARHLCDRLRSDILEIEQIQESPSNYLIEHFNKVIHCIQPFEPMVCYGRYLFS